MLHLIAMETDQSFNKDEYRDNETARHYQVF